MSRPLLVYLIAGEPSGDALGAKLMTALRAETGGGVEFAGVGGAMMTAEGLTTLFPMSDLTVMGIAEVLPNILTILSRIRQTAADVAARRADVVVTIDAPDFCFRVAKRLKGKGIPLVHYVAPSVWAWRPGRARKIAALVDHVLCLLPFEPPYFERVGLTATFVGHSILESGAGSGDGTGFRSRHGIPPSAPMLAVLPGSRGSEITRLLGPFGETVAVLAAAMPNLHVVVPTVPGVAERVRETVASWPRSLAVEGETEKYDAFAAADAALAASGTVTVELAMAGVPTVVAYRVAALTAFVARQLLRIPHVTLINLIAGRAIYPEFIQDDCTPAKLTAALRPLLTDAAAREDVKSVLAETLAAMRRDDLVPSTAAARAVLSVLKTGGD